MIVKSCHFILPFCVCVWTYSKKGKFKKIYLTTLAIKDENMKRLV